MIGNFVSCFPPDTSEMGIRGGMHGGISHALKSACLINYAHMTKFTCRDLSTVSIHVIHDISLACQL